MDTTLYAVMSPLAHLVNLHHIASFIVLISAISWVARKIGECLGCAEKKDDGQLKNDKQGGNCVFSSGKNYSHAEKGKFFFFFLMSYVCTVLPLHMWCKIHYSKVPSCHFQHIYAQYLFSKALKDLRDRYEQGGKCC